MTSPTIPGTHAGACNSVRFGCELVGDYQVRSIPMPLLTLASGAMAALHRYARLATANVWAHRNCMPGRTCPGDAAYAQKGRA